MRSGNQRRWSICLLAAGGVILTALANSPAWASTITFDTSDGLINGSGTSSINGFTVFYTGSSDGIANFTVLGDLDLLSSDTLTAFGLMPSLSLSRITSKLLPARGSMLIPARLAAGLAVRVPLGPSSSAKAA